MPKYWAPHNQKAIVFCLFPACSLFLCILVPSVQKLCCYSQSQILSRSKRTWVPWATGASWVWGSTCRSRRQHQQWGWPCWGGTCHPPHVPSTGHLCWVLLAHWNLQQHSLYSHHPLLPTFSPQVCSTSGISTAFNSLLTWLYCSQNSVVSTGGHDSCLPWSQGNSQPRRKPPHNTLTKLRKDTEQQSSSSYTGKHTWSEWSPQSPKKGVKIFLSLKEKEK